MLNLTVETFHAERQKPGHLVVDFWGVWCPPCKAMNPILDKVAAAFPGVTFAKVNSTENPELVEEYKVQAIPAFILFKDGEVVHRWSGLMNDADFGAVLTQNGVTREN